MALEKYFISKAHPSNVLLRWSFRIKFLFILAEFVLAGIFGVAMLAGGSLKDPSVIVEWVVGMLFSFYMWSFAADFCTGTSPRTTCEDTMSLARDIEKLWEAEIGSLRRPSTARTSWSTGRPSEAELGWEKRRPSDPDICWEPTHPSVANSHAASTWPDIPKPSIGRPSKRTDGKRQNMYDAGRRKAVMIEDYQDNTQGTRHLVKL